jgi:uncharacterized membrane protein
MTNGFKNFKNTFLPNNQKPDPLISFSEENDSDDKSNEKQVTDMSHHWKRAQEVEEQSEIIKTTMLIWLFSACFVLILAIIVSFFKLIIGVGIVIPTITITGIIIIYNSIKLLVVNKNH